MKRACLLLAVTLAATALAGEGHAQVAFTRGETLYALNLDRRGLPRPGAHHFRVTRLWPMDKWDDIAIGWTPRGQIWLDHSVDTIHGGKYYDMPDSKIPPAGIWLVMPESGAKPRKLVSGHGPSFSPDGKRMAYVTTPQDHPDGPSQVLILDLDTRKSTLFATNAQRPTWSPKGDRIAVVRFSGDVRARARVDILRYPSGEVARSLPPMEGAEEISFSPDESWITAQIPQQVRPFLFDLRSGAKLSPSHPEGFDSQAVDDWTSDGKWVLCLWAGSRPGVRAPKALDCAYLGLSPLGRGKPRLIGLGANGQLTSDGLHMVFIREHSPNSQHGGYDLVWGAINPGAKTTVLAYDVWDFAVMRKPTPLQRSR